MNVRLIGCDANIRKVLYRIKDSKGVHIEVILSGSEKEEDLKALEELAKQKKGNIVIVPPKADKARKSLSKKHPTFFKPHVKPVDETRKPLPPNPQSTAFGKSR